MDVQVERVAGHFFVAHPFRRRGRDLGDFIVVDADASRQVLQIQDFDVKVRRDLTLNLETPTRQRDYPQDRRGKPAASSRPPRGVVATVPRRRRDYAKTGIG